VTLLVAIGCGGPEPSKIEAASASLRFPSAGFFDSARVEVEDTPRYYGSLFCFKGSCNDRPASATHWLRLDGAAGHRDLELAYGYVSRYSGAGTEPGQFEALRHARYQLRASADGRVLALSSDGGAHYRYVRLDTASPSCKTHLPGSRDALTPSLPNRIPGDGELYSPGPGGDPFVGATDSQGSVYTP